ncbi:MAG: ATP synthase F1 subunit epsilon [Candidatus Melainabacteria bacterium]|nr:ATP synthase F1 subunit epsilon [Candidatus Melainabacteria bacterium]
MSGTFNLKILTPERVVLDTVVSQVTATARDGQLSILAHHEPLVTALGIDALKYWEDGEEKSAAVIGGVLEVANHQTATAGTDQAHNPDDLIVTIISDSAELGTEIDEARAKKAEQRAEAEKTQKVDKLDTQLAEMALSRAVARLRAVEIARDRRRGR